MSWLPAMHAVIRLHDGRIGALVSGEPDGWGQIELADGTLVSMTHFDIAEVLSEPTAAPSDEDRPK